MSKGVDLDKIAEFMNSDSDNNEIKQTDKQEIENTLDYIDTQLSEVKKQTKKVANPEDVKQQETTIENLTQMALTQFGKVDKNTDEIYQLFYGNLALGKDRSDASKVALLDSQRLKVELIESLASLANAKARLELAKQKTMAGTGIFVNAQSGADVGISLSDLWKNADQVEDEDN